MDQKYLQLLVVMMAVTSLGTCNKLADIAFPCVKDIALIVQALDYVCLGGKQDPEFEKFLNENGRKRVKREMKLLDILMSPTTDTPKIEEPWIFRIYDDIRIEDFKTPNIMQENSDESIILEPALLSNFKAGSRRHDKRMKREDQGPNLLEKTIQCCENSHRVRTSCTLKDLKPYCEDFISGPSDMD